MNPLLKFLTDFLAQHPELLQQLVQGILEAILKHLKDNPDALQKFVEGFKPKQ